MTSAAMRPRVALYIHQLPIANPTGVHRYAIELAEALVRTSTDLAVELCSGRTPGRADPDLEVPVTHPSAPRRPLHLAWTLTSRPGIERVVGRLDLLHLSLPTFPIRSAAPQVITIHDLLPYHHPDWYEPFPRWTFRRAVEFHVRAAAAIITPSQVVADDVVGTLGVDPARIAVIHEGVTGALAAGIDSAAAAAVVRSMDVPDRPFLATVGAVMARKNLEVVIRALARLGSDAPDFVVVGGDGLGADAVRAAVDECGVADRVHFVGRLSDPDLRAVLDRASALVHPSRYEGFGLTPLEAMAAGLPVIASRAGSLPEVLGSAAWLVDPDDEAAWASAVETVLGDPATAERLRRAGAAHVADFTWERAAELTAEVYRRTLSR